MRLFDDPIGRHHAGDTLKNIVRLPLCRDERSAPWNILIRVLLKTVTVIKLHRLLLHQRLRVLLLIELKVKLLSRLIFLSVHRMTLMRAHRLFTSVTTGRLGLIVGVFNLSVRLPVLTLV